MIIRLSQKLAQKLHVKDAQALPLHENAYLDWYAHFFVHNRMPYFMIMNCTSLFTVVFKDHGINNTNNFLEQFGLHLDAQCSRISAQNIYTDTLLPALESPVFSKAIDRKVTGCMNEQISFARHILADSESTFSEIPIALNKNFMSTNDYMPPENAFAGTSPYITPDDSSKILKWPGT